MSTGKTPVNEPLTCSFCGRSELEVKNLIVQDGASICDNCVKAAEKLLPETGLNGQKMAENYCLHRKLKTSLMNM